jgi:hypothetical protein
MLLEFAASFDIESEPQDHTNYNSRIDDILMDLISNYDKEELELKKQQDYYRFIFENNGDVSQAEAQFQAMEELESTRFQFGKQMLKWAIYDDNDQTNMQVRKFGFQHTKLWFRQAVSNFDAKLQSSFPTQFRLQIDGWEGISNGNDYETQVQSIKNHFENHKFQTIFVNTPNMAATIVLIAAIGLAFITPFSLIPAVLSTGILAFRTYHAIKQFPLRTNAAISNLNAVMNEISEFRRYCETERGKKSELFSFIEFL